MFTFLKLALGFATGGLSSIFGFVAAHWRVVAIMAIATALFFAGWHFGTGHVQTEWNAAKAAQAAAVAKIETKQAEVTTRVVTQYVDRVQVIHDQAKTITKRVPIYVTAKNDAACTINNGFVRLWNAANSGLQVPATPGPTDGASSGIVLSDVATQHSIESDYTRGLETQLNSLQDWIEGEAAAAAP